MKKPVLSLCLVAASLALAGCSSASLLGGSRGPDAAAVPTGRNLAMPPDLQLPAPGSGTASAYQEPAPAPGTYSTAAASPPADDGVYGGAPATPRRIGGKQCNNGTQAADIYGCYNISKLKPDGTKKTQAELSAELRVAMLEEKRRANPNYGTFKNFGGLFN